MICFIPLQGSSRSYRSNPISLRSRSVSGPPCGSLNKNFMNIYYVVKWSIRHSLWLMELTNSRRRIHNADFLFENWPSSGYHYLRIFVPTYLSIWLICCWKHLSWEFLNWIQPIDWVVEEGDLLFSCWCKTGKVDRWQFHCCDVLIFYSYRVWYGLRRTVLLIKSCRWVKKRYHAAMKLTSIHNSFAILGGKLDVECTNLTVWETMK